MIWTFVVIWVVGGVLFGFMVWAGAVGFAGAFSRRRSWSASKQQHRKEVVGRPFSSQPTACRLHVVHAERPTSWHLYPLHGSRAGARPQMVNPSVHATTELSKWPDEDGRSSNRKPVQQTRPMRGTPMTRGTY